MAVLESTITWKWLEKIINVHRYLIIEKKKELKWFRIGVGIE